MQFSINRVWHLLYLSWLSFAINYRRTALGPLWIIAGPLLFIGTLGFLFAQVNRVEAQLFIPHLAVGLIVWTLINGFISSGSKVFVKNRSKIFQAEMSMIDIVIFDVCNTCLQFLHQIIIVVLVIVVMGISITPAILISFVGVLLLMLNGVWLTFLFGVVGARYRDLPEINQAIMRIAFLATPIIWMPDANSGRGALMTAFLEFNPFYHFIQIVRAPILGQSISMLSVAVVISISVLGSALAINIYARHARRVPLWL